MKKNIIKNSLFGITALVLSTSTLVSCNGNKTWIDYAHNSDVKCQLEYQGKDFFTDGIGEVKLYRHIDGDTDHFLPINETSTAKVIKSRYYGIDTPESTGRIQEWGVTASNFTKEKVKNANDNGTIVVSSVTIKEYKKPEHDSTGERYVSLIWINETVQHAPISELTLLNLWIVQEGFSWVKGVDLIPDFADTFYKAQDQAKSFEKHIFSKEKDPNFNYGDYISVSILELKEEIEKSIEDPTHVNKYNGQKVIIIGNVAAYTSNTLYIQDTYDVEYTDEATGQTKIRQEQASINIFCGQKAPSELYTAINTRLEIPCTANDSENFGFQLSGVEGHFPTDPKDAGTDDVKIKAYPKDNVESALVTKKYTAAELAEVINSTDPVKHFECLNCSIELTDQIYGYSCSLNDAGTEAYINFKNGTGEGASKLPFSLYVKNLQWLRLDPSKTTYVFKDTSDYLNRTFKIPSAIFTWHRTSSGKVNYQLLLKNNGSLIWDYDYPESIEIEQGETISIQKGKQSTLSVIVTPTDTNTLTGVQWESSNKDVARVSTAGIVSAVGVGTCTITAKTFSKKSSYDTMSEELVSDSIEVTVTE